jgi:hypothetical protein
MSLNETATGISAPSRETRELFEGFYTARMLATSTV